MKPGPVTKRNKTTSKNFDHDVILEIVTSLSFFLFMVNLEQSASRVTDAEAAKLMFSLIVTLKLIVKNL